MKSSVVVSYGRNVTVSCTKCITAMRMGLVAAPVGLGASSALAAQGNMAAVPSVGSRSRREIFIGSVPSALAVKRFAGQGARVLAIPDNGDAIDNHMTDAIRI